MRVPALLPYAGYLTRVLFSPCHPRSLLVCVCRLRYLDEQLLVALLRRLRDTLPAARGGELAAVLRALAACGVRPSP